MPQPMGFRVRLGWSGWVSLLIALGVVIAIATVVAVLLLGVFIVLLPIMLVAGLLYYLFPSLRYPRPGQQDETDIIEGEYRIIDPRQIDRDSPSDDRP